MDAKTIIDETNLIIDTFENDLINLNEKCIEYSRDYEVYIKCSIYDGKLLKEQMKTAIIQAVPNDI